MFSFLPKSIVLMVFSCIFVCNVFAQSDNCASATLIVSDSTCINGSSQLINQTLVGATNVDYSITSPGCSFSTTAKDVWYKFVAKTKTPVITISNAGSGWGGIANVKIQILSGNCSVGGFTQIACGNGPTLSPTLLNGLTEGITYFLRIHNNTTTVSANSTFDICITDAIQKGSRMNEVFSRTVLSPALLMNYPWEITYGPDDSLWITESRGYKVSKMNATNGGKRTVLDLSFGSTWFGATGTGAADTLYAQQSVATWNTIGWPQGGFAGLALHPSFGKGAGKDFVYITYVWKYLSGSGTKTGVFFQNKLVRFTYNSSNGRLESPAVLDWNLPGSTDHNSQRLIIAPVVKNGTPYLFMSQGDMGAGQFGNRDRPNNAQNSNSYEGKILRFNLESDGDAGLNAWLPNAPNANPYSATSAVYSIGIRNNQGFAYDTANNILFGTSHGPYSDDELNVIESRKNYGHPLVIGYAADGNYNGNLTPGTSTSVSAGADFTDNSGNSSCPAIGDETVRKNAINTADPGSYRDPLFSAYPTPSAGATGIKAIWNSPGSNANWQSEAWSGLDLYTDKIIPGWKRSLVASGLKWGRLIKLNLNGTGTATLPSNIGGALGNAGDTITYFQSTNRYRDLAFAPNGKDMFVVMDNSSATSGPGIGNPTTPACPGCVIKYSFLGYEDAAGLSTLPKTIAVTTGALNSCSSGTDVTIDGTNNFLWVPITGPDGNIMAEINAMGQSLGLITSSFYKNGSAVRSANGVKYLDRNITIKPAVTVFGTPVKVRLYISKTELDALIAAPSSGVISISSLKILKNNDACGPSLSTSTATFLPTNSGTGLVQGTDGYVLQTAVPSFSSFYFAANNILLPLDLIAFNGALQSDLSALLKWKTENEINTAGFELERSIDGNSFNKITFLKAKGNGNSISAYDYTDNDAADQQSTILYYRLKILDINGLYKYSDIVKISLPVAKAVISIAPNPVFSVLKGNILSPVAGNVVLRIFDNAGRIILQTSLFVKKGDNSLNENINQLASGGYYLDISGREITSRIKFQKL